eukprot:6073610-Prymnesium_polylepis.1
MLTCAASRCSLSASTEPRRAACRCCASCSSRRASAAARASEALRRAAATSMRASERRPLSRALAAHARCRPRSWRNADGCSPR